MIYSIIDVMRWVIGIWAQFMLDSITPLSIIWLIVLTFIIIYYMRNSKLFRWWRIFRDFLYIHIIIVLIVFTPVIFLWGSISGIAVVGVAILGISTVMFLYLIYFALCFPIFIIEGLIRKDFSNFKTGVKIFFNKKEKQKIGRN